MSRDQLNSGSSEEQPTGRSAARPDLIGLEPDQIEAARLADVMAAVERGDEPDLDPAEDPALVSLERTAAMLHSSLNTASAHESFRTFHERSRTRVLRATPAPRRAPIVEAPRESLLQRWNGLFTSVASAAAAAVATFVVTVIAIGGGSSATPAATVQSPEPPPEAAVSAAPTAPDHQRERVNLTALSISEQVSVYVGLLERLDALTDDGLPADEDLLRDLADTGAAVKRTIEQSPEVSGADVFVAMHATFGGQQALRQATVADDGELPALDTAQTTSEDAYVTAARFLSDHPDLIPSADDPALAAILAAGTKPDASSGDSEAAP